MNKFYITTAIDYVNGEPHIGHAYEKILTDVIFRHFKQRRDEYFFLTGTDEHGIKIQKTAAARGITPQALCDENAEKFKSAWGELQIDYSKFIRTTDIEHKKIVQKIFEKLLSTGDIYKNSYTGLYCSGCECFLNPKELNEEGLCAIHNAKPEEVSEENYFFRLSKYKDAIIKHIKENPKFILPAFRVNEILNQLEDIDDISVSRAKSSVNWGIDVLSDPTQVIYVWIDALSNYITALGFSPDGIGDLLYTKYWPANVQVVGKDILKFHAIYWPAILMALGVKLPKTIYAHGWITIDKSKMSKTTGNVIAPSSVLKAFELTEPDALRYFMCVSATGGKDGNYSDDEFKERVNADLANNMGNLLNRTLNMLVKYFDGEILKEHIIENELSETAHAAILKVKEHFDNYRVAEAADEILKIVDEANKFVNDNTPWTLAKEEKMAECGQVLYSVLNLMVYVGVLMHPFCPNITADIARQLNFDVDMKLDELKPKMIPSGKLIDKEDIKPVFLRLDSEFADKK